MSYIKKIRLRNFKCLDDITIDIKPLTFLFGPNSSGKSSFLKALMFLYNNLFINNSFTKKVWYADGEGNTIYNISDSIDFISFDNIANVKSEEKASSTKNQIRIKNLNYDPIVFEIELSGNINFPVKEILNPKEFVNSELWNGKFYGEEEDSKVIEEYLKSLPISNVSEFLESINSDVFTGFDNPQDLYEIYDYSYTIIVEFYQDNTFRLCEKNLSETSSNMFISEFNSGWSNSLQKVKDLCKKHTHKERLSRTRDGKFKGAFGNNIYSKSDKNIKQYESGRWWIEKNSYPKFDLLSQEKKIDVYYEYLIENYIRKHLLLPNLKSYLSYSHLPIVRELPKHKYLLKSDGSFGDNVYYSLLDTITNKQNPNFEFEEKESKDNKQLFNFSIKCERKFKRSSKGGLILGENEIIYIDDLLKNLGFLKRFSIYKNKDIGSIILINRNKKKYNLVDESSGLIQLLPIVLSSAISQTNMINKGKNIKRIFRLLLIEQPELHLHPNIQSKLAELFCITLSEYSTKVIETHSEHLIRKIQVLIARGELDKEKIGVYYFDIKDSKTKIKEMEIDDNGLFKEDWPDGFFDDSIDITLELYEALRKGKN